MLVRKKLPNGPVLEKNAMKNSSFKLKSINSTKSLCSSAVMTLSFKRELAGSMFKRKDFKLMKFRSRLEIWWTSIAKAQLQICKI